MAMTSVELWERALRSEDVALAEIEHMLKASTKEDLWLDWKGGHVVTAKNGPQVLQKAVAGFANAEGGVVVLGANGGDVGTGETPWTLTPCAPKIGKQGLQEWVEQQLVPLSSALRPPPRVAVIDGGIVLIAVQRSELLVQVVAPGRAPIHYLRLYGSTHEVPGYLLADLLLGRRKRPQLEVSAQTVTIGFKHNALVNSFKPKAWEEQQKKPWPVTFAIEVHNSGLVWAEDVAIGLVVHANPSERKGTHAERHSGPQQRIPTSVQANITGRQVPPFDLVHRVMDSSGDLAPFGTTRFEGITGCTPSMVDAAMALDHARRTWWSQHHPGQGMPVSSLTGPGDWRIRWLAPLYVLARNAPPVWFQVELVFDERQDYLANESSVRPAVGTPVVGIQARYRSFEAGDQWVAAHGWGTNPLAPAP